MCLRAPRSVEGMIGVYGMGERKYEKYAARFFAVIEPTAPHILMPC